VNSPNEIRVIESRYRWSQGLRELYSSREVLFEMVQRQVKIRYKQTGLGVLWVFLQPLIYTGILAAVFSQVARFDTGGYPYPAFVLCVFAAWLFFTRAIGEGTQSLLTERSVITKVYFPRLIVPLASLSAAAIDMLVAYAVILPVVLVFMKSVSLSLLFLPVAFVLLFLLSLGIVSITSAVNALYRDVGFAVGFLIQLLFYLSPVLYPSTTFSGRWYYLLMLNPLTGLFESIRWAILPAYPFPGLALGVAVCEIALLLAVGPSMFAKFEVQVADRI
jgi:lipopolysaccharide transport system permease protein